MTTFKYKLLSYSDLIDLAVKVGYDYDGDPNSHSDNTEGVLIGLNEVGKDGWEFIFSKEWRYFFKKGTITVNLDKLLKDTDQRPFL